MKDTLKLAAAILFMVAVILSVMAAKIAVNTYRFPDSPFWTRLF